MTERRNGRRSARNFFYGFNKLRLIACAFGKDNHVRRFATLCRLLNAFGNFSEIDFDFRNENVFASACKTCVKRNIAAVSTHNFYYRNTLVSRVRISKMVNCPKHGVYSRIETDCKIGVSKVVVNRSRKSCYVDSEIVEQIESSVKRAVAADNDKIVDIAFSEIFRRLHTNVVILKFRASCGMQNRAALLNDITDASRIHLENVVFDKSAISPFYAVGLITTVNAITNSRSDAGVHTRCVAATC